MHLGAEIIFHAPISFARVKHRGERCEAKPLNRHARIKIKLNIDAGRFARREDEATSTRDGRTVEQRIKRDAFISLLRLFDIERAEEGKLLRV